MEEKRVRIVGQEKGSYRISDSNEIKIAEVSGKFIYNAKTLSDYPAVGDYAVALWSDDDSNSVITALYPRRSCFILKALRDNTLDYERFESYLKLKKENAFITNEKDYLEAKNAKYKEISKINKANRKR